MSDNKISITSATGPITGLDRLMFAVSSFHLQWPGRPELAPGSLLSLASGAKAPACLKIFSCQELI